MASTARADVRTALYNLLLAFKTANPTMLRKVERRRPGGFAETPCAYIGPITETIIHTSGIRQRTLAPTVVLVDTFRVEGQAEATDAAVDALIDYFTANPQPTGFTYGVLQQTGLDEGEIEVAGAAATLYYPAWTFVFGAVTVMEGRN